MSARLAFVRETTMPILSISGMRRYWAVPSASEIAVLTLSTPMTFSTRATTRTGDPQGRPERAVGRYRRVDDGDGDDRGEAELGEVERELHRALAPVEVEGEAGADDPRDDERRRRDEEEAGDQRELAHRERVGAAPDVQVDDLGLGQVETGGDQPDGDREGQRDRRIGRNEDQGQAHGQGREDEREQPDSSRAGRPGDEQPEMGSHGTGDPVESNCVHLAVWRPMRTDPAGSGPPRRSP